MTVVQVDAKLNKTDMEQGLIQLRTSFRLTDNSITAFLGKLTETERGFTKFVSAGVSPVEAGLAKLDVAFKGPIDKAPQLVGFLRDLAAAQTEANKSIDGSKEALTEQNRLLQEELALRKQVTTQLQAQKQNATLNLPINRFLAATHGGPSGLEQFQADRRAIQASLSDFSSTLFSKPIESLKILATDSRAAGAALQFLKGELDFVIGSRFGAIAIGFAIFGTIEETIRRSITALAEFEDHFAKIRALHIGEANATELDAQAKNFLRNITLQTGIALSELTEKYLDAASAGGTAAKQQALFTNAMTLAKATNADLRETILQLSGIYNVFGHQLKNVESDSDRLRIVTSLLYTAFGKSTGTGQDFVQALKFVGGSASIADVSLTRLLGIIGILNDQMVKAGLAGRGLDQVLRTISNKPDEFSKAFKLDLTPQQIIEAPIAALELLRKKFQEGLIDRTQLQANLTMIFPRNATRAVYDIVAAAEDLMKTYDKLAEKAIDIAQVHETVFGTLATKFKQTGAILFETFLVATGEGEGIEATVSGMNRLVAGLGTVVTLSSIPTRLWGQFGIAVESVGEKLTGIAIPFKRELTDQELSFQRLIRLALGLNTALTPIAELRRQTEEAMKSRDLEAEARLRLTRGEEAVPKTPTQQLEIDLARHKTVEIEKQIALREADVREAERSAFTALRADEKEKAVKAEVAALTALTQVYLKGIQQTNEEAILKSDQLTEKHRSQAAITKELADEEVRARRGIMAALQGQQAAIQQLIDQQKIDAFQGTRLIVERQRQVNAELEHINKFTEAFKRSAEQRVEAERKVREAQDKVVDTQQRVLTAQREEEAQRRKTLETEAAGRVRILLATQIDSTTPLLKQLNLMRSAQEDANLPLKERIHLLEQEAGIIEKIRGKEESRLALEIEYGKNLPALLAAQRKFVEAQLAQDPAKLIAAQKLAALRGHPGIEGTIKEAAGILGAPELATFLDAEMNKQLNAVEDYREKRAKQGLLMLEDLQNEINLQIKAEQERTAGVLKAIRERDQALDDQKRENQKLRELNQAPNVPAPPERPIREIAPNSFTNTSLLDQERVLQDFNAGIQESSLKLAGEFVTPFTRAKEEALQLSGVINEITARLPVTAQRMTAALTDRVEQGLIDRLAREIDFPTGSA